METVLPVTRDGGLLEVRVTRIDDAALSIRCFTLELIDGGTLPAFVPGSHVDVHLPGGLIRQYSICSDACNNSSYRLGVKMEDQGKGGSRAMHQLEVGDVLTIGHPRNNFRLAAEGERHILVAGGIGITPLLSMYWQLRGSETPFEFHYSARSSEHAAFVEDLRGDERVGMVFSPEPAEVEAYFRERLATWSEGSHLYICGPGPFMDAIVRMARAWPEASIHLERFSAVQVDPNQEASFVVQLASTGEEFVVQPGMTIVDALLAHDVQINTSCEQGICGTCLTNVIGGVPDHRDSYLTAEERESGKVITPCVSRCKSARLVLDL